MQSNEFMTILSGMCRGQTMADVEERLAELLAAVKASSKTGSLTVKLTVKPNGGNSFEFEDTVSAKVPQLPRGKSIFFLDETTGALTRDDPRQQRLPLREVAAPEHHKQSLKEVG